VEHLFWKPSDAKKKKDMKPEDQELLVQTKLYRKENVLCFGYKNRRNRFFIPTQDSSFGGLVVGPVMFDSGCNTLLLPFPSVEQLESLFGPAFTWSIHTARSASGKMLTLFIKGLRRMFSIIIL